MIKGRLHVFLLVVSLMLGGCITDPTIHIKFEPNPVVMKPGDKRIEIEFSIEVAGFGEVYVEEVVFRAVTKDNQVIMEQSIPVRTNIPGFGIGFSHEIWLPISYNQAKETNLGHLLVEVRGRKASVFMVEVELANNGNIPLPKL